MAITDPNRKAEVVEALKPNPQGNAGEMTPLVVIRDRRPAPTTLNIIKTEPMPMPSAEPATETPAPQA